jgi:hypothetical protein
LRANAVSCCGRSMVRASLLVPRRHQYAKDLFADAGAPKTHAKIKMPRKLIHVGQTKLKALALFVLTFSSRTMSIDGFAHSVATHAKMAT